MKDHQAQLRRKLLSAGSIAAAATLVGAPLVSHAQSMWPNRPIRIIVPFAAGQGADVLGRLLAQELEKSLGQPIVVDNRAGAGGNIGTAAAARSKPDGYTFLVGSNATHAANEFLYPTLGFDPAMDFDCVAMIGQLPMVVATSLPDLPTNGVAELVARARAKPNTLNVGLPGTTAQVVFAQFVKSANAPLFGVRYKSSGQVLSDAVGGQIPVVIDTVAAARPLIAAGKLRALGISSLKASEMLPGVKPIAEQGVSGFELVPWAALFAPKGTPPEVIHRMSDDVGRIVRNPEIRRRMIEIGVEPVHLNATQLEGFAKAERPKWGGIIKAANIRLD